jgi:hypothetical protein
MQIAQNLALAVALIVHHLYAHPILMSYTHMIHKVLACFNFDLGTGSEFNKIRPEPTNPLCIRFALLIDLRVQNSTHTYLLMGGKPTGSRVVAVAKLPYPLELETIEVSVAKLLCPLEMMKVVVVELLA